LVFLVHVGFFAVSACPHTHNPRKPCQCVDKKTSPTSQQTTKTSQTQNTTQKTSRHMAPRKPPQPHKEKKQSNLRYSDSETRLRIFKTKIRVIQPKPHLRKILDEVAWQNDEGLKIKEMSLVNRLLRLLSLTQLKRSRRGFGRFCLRSSCLEVPVLCPA